MSNDIFTGGLATGNQMTQGYVLAGTLGASSNNPPILTALLQSADLSAANTEIDFRVGEKGIVLGRTTDATAMLSIHAGATFILKDHYGVVVPGFNGVPITGYTADPAISVYCWYDLDTTGIAPGVYYGLLDYEVESAPDGLTRRHRPEVIIRILADVEVIATYDPTTDLGKVRYYLQDTDTTAPVNSDVEIGNLLAATNGGTALPEGTATLGQIYWAASIGLKAMATTEAKLATVEKFGLFGTDSRSVYKALIAQAKEMFALACAEVIGVTTAPLVKSDGTALDPFPPQRSQSHWDDW